MYDFEHFIPGIEKALSYGGDTHTVEDVVQRVLDGKAKLWSEGDALIFAEVRDYPEKRVLQIWMATGELEDVLALHEKVLEWGRAVGCTLAMFTGRLGWQRALRDRGWESTRVEMHRRL